MTPMTPESPCGPQTGAGACFPPVHWRIGGLRNVGEHTRSFSLRALQAEDEGGAGGGLRGIPAKKNVARSKHADDGLLHAVKSQKSVSIPLFGRMYSLNFTKRQPPLCPPGDSSGAVAPASDREGDSKTTASATDSATKHTTAPSCVSTGLRSTRQTTSMNLALEASHKRKCWTSPSKASRE